MPAQVYDSNGDPMSDSKDGRDHYGSETVEREKVKQPYQTPVLIKVGSVVELTQGGRGATPDIAALGSR